MPCAPPVTMATFPSSLMMFPLPGPMPVDLVTANCLLVERDAEPGSFRQCDHPVRVDLERLVEQLAPERVRILVKLEQSRIGQRGNEMQVGDRCNRRGKNVRDHRQMIRLGK